MGGVHGLVNLYQFVGQTRPRGGPGYFIGLLRRIARFVAVAALHLSQACAGSPMFDQGLAAYLTGDIATAYQLWRPLAEHGDADAQFAFGSLYYDGIGVPVDHAESNYWFHLAAKQGHAGAQYNLGNAYLRGEGVRKNEAMAVHWWRKAAVQNLVVAQFNLAKAYQEGVGVEKDEQIAAHWYEQLAEKDHPLGIAMNIKLDMPVQSVDEVDCEGWLGNQPPNAYTVQLISTRRPEAAYELARQYDLAGYVVCSYAHEEHTRHALLLGAYPSADAAREAVAGLPPELKTGRPWIRKITSLKQLVLGNTR